MNGPVMSKSESIRDTMFQTETIDIKYEVRTTNDCESDQCADINDGFPDSVHSSVKEPNDLEYNFLQCERNCETCQMYIQKLKEHMKAAHGIGGQPILDPLHIEIPHSSSNPEIKCEIQEVDSMDCESETEIMFGTVEKNDGEIVSDDRSTTTTRKSDYQNLRALPMDPLNAENPDGNYLDGDSDYVEERKSQSLHFPCPTCHKCYSSLNELKAHMRIIHGGDEGIIKPFKCEECGNGYASKYSLIDHKKIHTGEGLFTCDDCQKSFIRSGSLIQHKRIHTGEGMFKCDECEKLFARSDHLVVHKRTHTGERPYKCAVCGKSFTRSSELTRHLKIHSREIIQV